MEGVRYPATYRDRHGEEATTILNDGRFLEMTVRGVQFRGRDFDGLEPVGYYPATDLASFTLWFGALCACAITCRMPLLLVDDDVETPGELTVLLRLGMPRPAPPDGLDAEELQLELTVGDQSFRSRGTSGWFEDELLDIQGALPPGMYLKSCLTCAFSDYSPYGHGLFGNLACFRGNKVGYRAVQSKSDLFRAWRTLTAFVQETYLCPEFERRAPGTGYRG